MTLTLARHRAPGALKPDRAPVELFEAAWATPEEVPDFGVDIAGVAGPVALRTPSGDKTYVSGVLYLDASTFAALEQNDPDAGVAIIAHELGHLMGLAHVNDPQQVMYPRASGQLQFGPGDLAGLNRLGRGACQPDV